MAINKVNYGDRTLIDLTDSTLTSSDELVEGVTAYDRSGNRITGTADYMDKIDNPTADKILIDDGNGQAEDSLISIGDVMTKLQVDLTARGEIITNDGAGGIASSGTQLSDLATQSDLSGKQDTLTAGNGIGIASNTISVYHTVLSNVDLDTVFTEQLVYCQDSCTNKPTSNGGLLISRTSGMTSGAYGAQMFIPHSATGKGVYYRRRISSTWTAWTKIFDASNVIGAANGGTGETTLKDGCIALIGALSSATGTVIDGTPIITGGNTAATANTAYYRRNASAIWNYILNKLDGATGTVTASTTNFTSSTFVLTKSGKVCTLFFTGTIKVTANGWITVGTIPTGYRPSAIVNFDVYTRSTSNNYEVMSLLDAIITTSGAIQIYAWSGNNNQIVRKQFTYICS